MSTTLQPKIYRTVVGSKKYFSSFEGLVMAVFWHKRLSCIDELSAIIQAKGISLEVKVNLIKKNLPQEIQKLRDLWADILQESRSVAQEMELPPSTAEYKFKTCVVYKVLDFFLQELEDRFKAANSFCELFSPVLKYNSLNEKELKAKASTTVQNQYVRNIRKQHAWTSASHPVSFFFFCALLLTAVSAGRAVLGNVSETWQRAPLSRQRLNSLSLPAIVHSLASALDFADVIYEFANERARK
ncbi:hypothetical protein PR048_031711, partial [Dryococelus australis]